MAASGRETELKLLLPDGAALRRLLVVLGPELPALQQHNVYYDGPEGEWSRAGLAIRLRQENDLNVLTVKTAGELQGDFVSRGEWERTLESEQAWRCGPGGPALESAVMELLDEYDVALPSGLREVPLVETGTMDNLRRRALLPSEDPAIAALVVELDTTTYPNDQRVHEVELEVEDPGLAEPAVQVLQGCFQRAGVPWQPSSVSKRARLERVLRGESA